jgi:hypothetical protein
LRRSYISPCGGPESKLPAAAKRELVRLGPEEEVSMGVCVTNKWLSHQTGAPEGEDRIRARARQIWEQVGRSGRPDDYRFQADIELELGTPAREGPSTGAIAGSGNVRDAQR